MLVGDGYRIFWSPEYAVRGARVVRSVGWLVVCLYQPLDEYGFIAIQVLYMGFPRKKTRAEVETGEE